MAEVSDGAENRSGCLIGRLLGAVARLVLVYPLVCIGSSVGQSAQLELWPDVGTAYEGALAGSLLSLVIGLSLWLGAIARDGWRPLLANAALACVTAVWLATILVGATDRMGTQETLMPWIACLSGSALIALLLRV